MILSNNQLSYSSKCGKLLKILKTKFIGWPKPIRKEQYFE